MAGLFNRKPDGVITSVRYESDGRKLELIRLYERRGAIYGDLELLTREELVERMEAGKKYLIGQRQGNVPGSFATGETVELFETNDGSVLRTKGSDRFLDFLEGAPIF